MRRTLLIPWVVLFLAFALFIAVAAGCGGDSSSSGGSSEETAAAAADLSADEIVKESEAKMAQVKSASFTADVALEMQGDPEKMTDPTAQAMLSDGVTLHAEGQSASDPTAADMKMSVSIAGQNLDFGMMTDGANRGSSIRAPGTRWTTRTRRLSTSRRRSALLRRSSSRVSDWTRPSGERRTSWSARRT